MPTKCTAKKNLAKVGINSKKTLPRSPKPRIEDCAVFIDFDNTITAFDVLDDIIKRFSVNNEWVALENAWQEGKIGSRECLDGQIRLVKINKSALLRYLAGVKLDPGFKKLLNFFDKKGVRPIIVSDSFSTIIKEVLEQHKADGMKIYANRLQFTDDGLVPVFPYTNLKCPRRAAHCKARHLSEAKGKTKVYIGDGLSDICAAEKSDIVFAKGSLLKYLRGKNIHCIPFKNLGDICNHFK
ncbi:MAG: MtnX-like HAD-IB family phosphatase [Candidatus Omnitrophica bacterium]|nr:MtnX-like HAD-IB family phosphatase [Candidatus Omnitrophota bacterium]